MFFNISRAKVAFVTLSKSNNVISLSKVQFFKQFEEKKIFFRFIFIIQTALSLQKYIYLNEALQFAKHFINKENVTFLSFYFFCFTFWEQHFDELLL